MKYLFSPLFAAALFLLSFCAGAQSSPSPARTRADSLQRMLLQDSLGLGTCAIATNLTK